MKNLKIVLLCLTVVFILTESCGSKNYPTTEGLPPGQAKKVTGSQSAKPYAPGQQKKH
jgi:hypothetical protein